MNVPFLNLNFQHQKLKNQLMDVFAGAIDKTQFIGGEQVTSFESEFSAFCNTAYCEGVNSGTDALRFAFIAAGIGPGDAIITVPNTFIATTEAISQAGATIILSDVDERTHLIDPERLEETIRKNKNNKRKIKAIVPVHLYGHVADMDPIIQIAQKHEIFVIEDACQAHGAVYRGSKKAGSMGSAGCFSFYPGKNLGACGEGGAVVTDSGNIDKRVRMLRDHGQSQKYYHELEGYNGRLDAIQAGILRIKLRCLNEWNEARRKNAKLYDTLLQDVAGIIPVPEPSWSTSVYHLYIIKTKKRDALHQKLADKGIGTAFHYPVPLHLQNAYKSLGYKKGDFQVAENHAQEMLSLPMYPELTEEQIVHVVNAIKESL
jgi:dTDP-4-amino-4,6-dideoxygalactose transaminase